MTLQKINIGTNPDGSARWHYISDGHVVLTGPITGSVTTSDGTSYDVTPEAIEVDPAHADEVAALIGDHYATYGHPQHTDAEHPFLHLAAPVDPIVPTTTPED